ncbi:hypothetical protein EON65_29260 [archaeon]|nr:MAG: hypothetical protein EON65_29260 [archaeon]
MRITTSSSEDALLAVRILYKIAYLLPEGFEDSPAHSLGLRKDRRIQQLVECADPHLKKLSTIELARYLWAYTKLSIDMGDVNSLISVLKEYDVRVSDILVRKREEDTHEDSPVPSREEVAAMIWTLGCLKDSYGIHDVDLMQDLITLFRQSKDGLFTGMNSRLIVRVLWSLVVYGKEVSRPCVDIYMTGINIVLANLHEFSAANKISLLWTAAEYNLHDKHVVYPLLAGILRDIREQPFNAQELVYLSEALRLHSQELRKKYVHLLTDKAAGKYVVESPSHLVEGAGGYYDWDLDSLLDAIETMSKLVSTIVRIVAKMEHAPSQSLLIAALRAYIATELHPDYSIADAKTYLDILFNKIETWYIVGNKTAHVPAKSAVMLLEALIQRPEHTHLLATQLNAASRHSTIQTVNRSALGIWELVIAQPRWHDIAGRLAVIITSRSVEVDDKEHLVLATYGVAALGHTYRPLYRVARRATQNHLNELSASSLSKLMVTIAAEDTASFASGGGLSVKLDNEFVDQIITHLLSRASKLTSVQELVQSMVSIAVLGRLATNGSKLLREEEEDSSALHIDTQSLRFLSAGQLMQLHWAMGRLPKGLFEDATARSVRAELQRREFSPHSLHALDDLALQHTFLLVKSFVDATLAKDDVEMSLKEKACSALVEQCAQLFGQSNFSTHQAFDLDFGHALDVPVRVDKPVKVRTEDEEGNEANEVKRLSVLIDTLQAFIELQHYSEALIGLTEQVLKNRQVFTSSNTCGVSRGKLRAQLTLAFRYGVLSELVGVYRGRPESTGQRRGKGPYPTLGVQGLLSRFFPAMSKP